MTTITTDSRDKYESIKQLQNLHLDIDFTVGNEVADERTITIQVKEAKSQANVSERVGFLLYLSDDAEGDGLIGTAPDGGIAVSAGSFLPVVADKLGYVVTGATGAASLIVGDSGAKTFYMVAVDPAGRLNVSGAITFAA